MPQANTEHTPTPPIDPYEGWPIGALEPVILDLQTTVAVFGHLINSPDEIGKNTWAKVETDLIVAAGQIRELWRAAWEQRIREDRAHEAALDAVRAEKATLCRRDDAAHAAMSRRMQRRFNATKLGFTHAVSTLRRRRHRGLDHGERCFPALPRDENGRLAHQYASTERQRQNHPIPASQNVPSG